MPLTELEHTFKARNGYEVAPGCLVKHVPSGTRGWAEKVFRDRKRRDLVKVLNEKTGGHHLWDLRDVEVLRPTGQQRARRIGIRNAAKDASQKLKRRRTRSTR